jgi:sortase B
MFKTNKNTILVSVYKKDKLDEDLNNTNVINTKEIYFSTDYIRENLELVSSFLNVIIIKQNISKVSVKDYNIVPIVLDVINLIPSIKELYIATDNAISYEIFIKLLDNKYLTNIDVFDIPTYLLERLDLNKDLDINLRCEILFISNFMESNNLKTYSEIYYKKNIVIDKEFKEIDTNDFLTFLNINKYLRVIEFAYFNEELFNFVMDEIFKFNLSNIRIIFREKDIDINEVYKVVNKYKENNDKELKNNNITFKIDYSPEYKKNNMFKQINLNILKGSLITVIVVVVLMMGINIYRNYKDNKKSDEIEKAINDIMQVNVDDGQTEEEDDTPELIEPNDSDMEIINSTTTTVYDIKYKMVFDELLAINDDTVGWLKVNNTNIDYPVVQSDDNDYYLKHDYYKSSNRHGWVFMDYRNSVNSLSRNTIIYGHNLSNQKMFGTLRYVLNSSWYKKASNQIITFNSIYENMQFQIFAIYRVPVTNDYLRTDFASDDDYLEFIDMIKSRSIYDFNVEVGADDKILTLSTCSNGRTNRLVVHAKLIQN